MNDQVKFGGSKIKNKNRLLRWFPFTFVATYSLNPGLSTDLYGAPISTENQGPKRTNFVSFNYDKYCNTFEYAQKLESTNQGLSNVAKKKTDSNNGWLLQKNISFFTLMTKYALDLRRDKLVEKHEGT